MAWLEKRKSQDGAVRWRVRDKIDGITVTVLSNASVHKHVAQQRLAAYEQWKAVLKASTGHGFFQRSILELDDCVTEEGGDGLA